MQIIADTHTHTNACSHAYSTLLENVAWAKKKGLKFLAVTEHAPSMPDAPHIWHFQNIVTAVPDVIDGVVVLKGCEVNVKDFQGGLDIDNERLDKLDWVIASMHPPVLTPGTIEQHTSAWLGVAQNPSVDVIGHSGDGRYVFDQEKVIRAFAEYGKIVEINSHSFRFRAGSFFNCREIAKCCSKYRVPVVMNSDSHFCMNIGDVADAIEALEEISFPKDLILNIDYDRFLEVARKKSGRKLVDD